MQATASQNRRVDAPAYQLSLSFAPEDNPAPELMERVADRVLSELGLAEHQTLLVAHHDREHQHVHALVNRIHPETFAPWDRWQDRAVLDRVLAQVEVEFGLRRVVEREHRLAERAVSLAPSQKPGQERTASERDFVARLRPLLPDIRSAQTWTELRDRLHEHGFELERRAHGLVLSDGTSRTKASSLAADVSLSRLESRLGPYTAEVAQGLAQTKESAKSPYEVERQTDAARQRLRQAEWAAERADRSAADVGRALGDTYVDPRSAALAFSRHAARHGDDRAVEALRRHPEQFGTLAEVERKHLFGLWTTTDDTPARIAAAEAASLANEWVGHRRRARELLDLQPDASANAVHNAFVRLRERTNELVTRLSPDLLVRAQAQVIPLASREISRALGETLIDRG